MTSSIKLLEYLQATWRLCQSERKDWDHNLMSDTEWCGFSRIWELEAGKEQSKSDDTSQSEAEVETIMILDPRELGDNASTHTARVQADLREGERRKKGCQQQTGETHRWLTYNMSPRRRTNGTVLQTPARQRAKPKPEEMNMGSDVDGVSSSGRLSARGDVETKENDELNRPLLQTISCSDLVSYGLWKQQCKKTYWARE